MNQYIILTSIRTLQFSSEKYCIIHPSIHRQIGVTGDRIPIIINGIIITTTYTTVTNGITTITYNYYYYYLHVLLPPITSLLQVSKAIGCVTPFKLRLSVRRKKILECSRCLYTWLNVDLF